MKKKNIFPTFVATVAALLFSFTWADKNVNAPVKYEVNTEESSLVWKGRKVAGEHFGNILLSQGYFDYDGKKLISGEFIIDMNSISNTDVTDAEYNKKLVDHLKSDDFFSTQKHATAVFKLTDAKASGKDQFEVTGNLTIKNITHPIKFPVTVTQNGNNLIVKGKAVVDRSKYDVRYGSGSFFENLGDKVIYDDFELDITIVSKKALAAK